MIKYYKIETNLIKYLKEELEVKFYKDGGLLKKLGLQKRVYPDGELEIIKKSNFSSLPKAGFLRNFGKNIGVLKAFFLKIWNKIIYSYRENK